MAKKAKKNNNDVEFFTHILPDNISANINVAQLGRVDRIYADGKKAQVQPLAMKGDGNSRAPLVGVHIGRMLRDEVHVGDVVVILFIDRSIAAFNGSNDEFPLSNTRMHSINDAFIIEVY